MINPPASWYAFCCYSRTYLGMSKSCVVSRIHRWTYPWLIHLWDTPSLSLSFKRKFTLSSLQNLTFLFSDFLYFQTFQVSRWYGWKAPYQQNKLTNETLPHPSNPSRSPEVFVLSSWPLFILGLRSLILPIIAGSLSMLLATAQTLPLRRTHQNFCPGCSWWRSQAS